MTYFWSWVVEILAFNVRYLFLFQKVKIVKKRIFVCRIIYCARMIEYDFVYELQKLFNKNFAFNARYEFSFQKIHGYMKKKS